MPKTGLTRAIEETLKTYHPAEVCGIKVNKFRPTHTAFEVPAVCGTTAGGIVDCLRVQEYYGEVERVRVCVAHRWKKEGIRRMAVHCPLGILDSEQAPDLCDETACRLNGVDKRGVEKVLITAYEIKITKSDFKSKNGHNFVGNCNYYVVPNELVKEIEPMVPEEIGIIAYVNTGKYIGLRRKKECIFRELTDDAQKWLILSTMKRLQDTTWREWREQAAAPYQDAGPW